MIFTFDKHRVEIKYPENGANIKLGNSYEYSAPPEGPDQRIFVLKFAAMKWFLNSSNQPDETIEPTINLLALDKFYNLHKRHAIFTYPHPVYGDLPCKFNKPLTIPAGEPGGFGVVKDIEIELIETPGLSDSIELTQIVYEMLP